MNDFTTTKGFLRAVAAAEGLTITEVERCCAVVARGVTAAIQAGQSPRIPNIGDMKVYTRPARAGRNPRTGEAIEIAETRALKFKPAPAVRDVL
jgi:DNA-binding protein HU-beta